MADVNLLTLTGTIASDFDTRVARGGNSISTEFILRNSWFSGFKRETQFITCRATGGAATLISKYCAKGDAIFVSGFIRLYPPESERPLCILRIRDFSFIHSPMFNKAGVDIFEADMDSPGGLLDLAAYREKRSALMAGEDEYTALTAEEIDDLLERDSQRMARNMAAKIELRATKPLEN